MILFFLNIPFLLLLFFSSLVFMAAFHGCIHDRHGHDMPRHRSSQRTFPSFGSHSLSTPCSVAFPGSGLWRMCRHIPLRTRQSVPTYFQLFGHSRAPAWPSSTPKRSFYARAVSSTSLRYKHRPSEGCLVSRSFTILVVYDLPGLVTSTDSLLT